MTNLIVPYVFGTMPSGDVLASDLDANFTWLSNNQFVSVFANLTAAQIADIQNGTTLAPNPATAIQQVLNDYAVVMFPPGNYPDFSPILGASGFQLNSGQIVFGATSGQFNSWGTSLKNTSVGGGIFWATTTTTASTAWDMPTIIGFNLTADYPVMINDPTVTIANSGAGLNPYMMAGKLEKLYCQSRVANVGTGISLSKCFDMEVTRCLSNGFDIGMLLQGCDIGHVHTNRIEFFNSFGILEIACANFGSQTLIDNNDILVGGTNAKFIQSCGDHIRIHNNYLEQQSTNAVGAIDASTIAIPQYGSNVASIPLEISIKDNRIDGQNLFTAFIYQIDGMNPCVNTIIQDPGTSGGSASIQLSTNNLPLSILKGNYPCQYDITLQQQSGSSPFARFQTCRLPTISDGLTIDSSSWPLMQNLTVTTGAAAACGYNGSDSIVVTPALNAAGNVFADLPNYGSNNKHPLEPGITYTLLITAKSTSSETLNVGFSKNGTGSGGTTGIVLTPQYTTQVVGQQIAPAVTNTWGVYFNRPTTTANIEIQSFQWVKNISAGYGTPTGGAIINNFPGATATLIQTSEQLAQLLTDLKTRGIIGA